MESKLKTGKSETGKIDKARLREAKEIEKVMHPLVREWFFSRFKEFSLTQQYGVMPIWERKNILVSAPTGGTKTLTAFLSIINYLVELASKKELEDKIYAVYISPLKALSNDIHKNLLEPLAEIGEIAKKNKIEMQEIRVNLRTGDTETKERQKQTKNSPHILVTTPESLAIIMNSPKFSEYIKATEFVIIDEIHALANKRGVHLSLSLERLEEMSKIVPVRIGLSATIAPIEEMAKFLTGNRECLIADVNFNKKVDIEVLSPVNDLIETDSIEMHTSLYKMLDKLIQEHKTSIIFTNTRAATERVIHHLKEMFPTKYLEQIGAHHSSLSKEHRFDIEERLRKGELKVVVSSTSLELGIDIGYVDLVILLGSPKSSARAMQRCLSYDSQILCSDGKYKKIGEIAEQKLPIEIISYNKERGFIKNKINFWHENEPEKLISIKLKCGEEIKCTKEHPLLTKEGWKEASKLKIGDLIAEIRHTINFEDNSPYLFELVPKEKIFVANKDNFFQKIIDEYLSENEMSIKDFAKKMNMPYFRLIDCRRIIGRKKSVRLDYFLKACEICKIPEKEYLACLTNLKTKGTKWPKLPLKLTKEIMWLAGIVATDGCIIKSKKENQAEYYQIKIGNKSKIMIDRIKEIIKKFEIIPYESLKEGFYNVEFGSNLFAYLFMSLGIPCKNKSYEISITNNVFSLSSELIHAYLEGIFEGDGNLNIKNNSNCGVVRIFSASKKFANGLHLVLSRIGYQNSIMKSKIKPSKLIKKVSDRDLYCVFFSRKEDLKKFFEEIPCYGEKAMRGRNITKNWRGYLSLREEYDKFINYSKIEDITNLEDKEKVYNLTLEKEPNNFIVGNIVVHNCGRAGHKLHDTAKGKFIILDRDDLVECSIIKKEICERKIDRVQIPKNCLDVLSQQIFGMAIYKVWDIREMFNLIKKSYCYSELSYDDFLGVISYLSGEYALEHRNVYAKIWYDNKTGQIGKRGKLARVIYMTNIGTIPDESYVSVMLASNMTTSVGKIDEEFLGRMKRGDVFVLGGQKYMFLYSRGMKAYVTGSVARPPTIPSWFSETLPLSFDLAVEISRFRSLIEERLKKKEGKDKIIDFIEEFCYCDDITAGKIYDYMNLQYKYIGMPSYKKIIVENYSGEKDYFIFHSLFGRRVNDSLSRALAFLVGRVGGRDVEIGINDNGFYLSGEKIDKEKIEKAINFLNEKNLEEVLKEVIDKTEVFKRRFRHCAARSLMILRNYKGRNKSAGKQQVASMFLLNSVQKLGGDFPILKETRREIMEEVMDIENAKEVIKLIQEDKIKIEYKKSSIPSPFSINLIMQGHYDLIKMEDKINFLKRIHQEIQKKIKE
ncbi:DEAD/DEAH box helicase [Candidatus Pacearchaeota archaeon]|nr:DEAD/DEAH box helicase [Candidatus Pacearchaeota archaeon]